MNFKCFAWTPLAKDPFKSFLHHHYLNWTSQVIACFWCCLINNYTQNNPLLVLMRLIWSFCLYLQRKGPISHVWVHYTGRERLDSTNFISSDELTWDMTHLSSCAPTLNKQTPDKAIDQGFLGDISWIRSVGFWRGRRRVGRAFQ